jgi:His-Xaa-Ser system protein HxsD
VNNEAVGIQSDLDSESSATIYLDPRIYTREAILKASYWATGVAYVQVPHTTDSRLAIRIELKKRIPTLTSTKPIAIQDFVKDFCNSLLDFELRHQVNIETTEVRQLILAKAFSESGVLEEEPPGTIADPVEMKKPTSLVQIIAPVASSEQ